MSRGDRLQFQLDVNRVLLSSTRPHHAGRMGMLTPSEMREADKCCEAGWSGEAFARMIERRDNSKLVA